MASYRSHPFGHGRNVLLGILLIAIVSACSTVESPGAEQSPARQQESATPKSVGIPQTPAQPASPVDLEFDGGSLVSFIRQFAQTTDQNVVLMNGLEVVQLEPYTFEDTPPAEILERVAADANLILHQTPHYTFLLANGYEQLTALDLADELDPSFGNRKANVGFGADTPLYAALALLSYSMKTTIVADNIVAGANCGEVELSDVPLSVALQAIFQSARITQGAFRIQSGDSVTFFYAPQNKLRTGLLVNRADAGADALRLLEQRVTLSLPSAPDNPEHLRGYTGAVPLQQCVESLSKQLGVRIMTDADTAQLPVNPSVIVDVPLKTALALIIHQWPVPDFGYEVLPGGIRFVRATWPTLEDL